MLQVEGLHLRRGNNEVLHDIHLQLHPGQVVGVLGPNAEASTGGVARAIRALELDRDHIGQIEIRLLEYE